MNSLVMLFDDLVQLQSQYHLLEVVFVMFLQAQDWLLEPLSHLSIVEFVLLLLLVLLT